MHFPPFLILKTLFIIVITLMEVFIKGWIQAYREKTMKKRELYLYHATGIENLNSIKEKGLLVNPPKHAYEEDFPIDQLDGRIFLSFDSEAAFSYAEVSEAFDEVVVLKIPLDHLDQDAFAYDWNNKCEYTKDINSCIYTKNIPADIIKKAGDEPFQDIFTFEGTDLYDDILETFIYECATRVETFPEYDDEEELENDIIEL